jgi:xanthine dehydrogenase accessory factor
MSLVIFGAGHDAVPVAAIAKQMGWHVTVADGRPAYAKASRFPGADRVVVMSSRDLLADIEVGPETAVVMMTHNYPQDARLLPLILPKRPWYLGLLGPKKRTTRLFDEIDEDLDAADVHAPVGLDIGADTPEGIAVSIVAEIRAALAGRSGGMLRSRSGSIHPAADEVGQRSRAMEPAGELVACSIDG